SQEHLEILDLLARRAVAAVVTKADLAGEALEHVTAPTLLIVGGDDVPVIGMNQDAMDRMRGHVELEIVPGATHLFVEPGTLDEAARLAARWFEKYLSIAAEGPHVEERR
ncbi:MAG: hypothetical protein ACNA8W_04560, partial [Bradymonadaceae bacterium]